MNKRTIYSSANQACCPSSDVVITEECMVFTDLPANTPVTLWNNSNVPYVTFSFYIDKYSGQSSRDSGDNGAGTVSITDSKGTNSYIVNPDSTCIIVTKNPTLVTITSVVATARISGRVCYRFYNKNINN